MKKVFAVYRGRQRLSTRKLFELADRQQTNIGCSPDDIDVNASMNDLGVGSRDSVVLSGELSELLGRPVSPVEFWQHPTITALARFLSGAEPDVDAEPVLDPGRGSVDEPIAVIGLGCRFPGEISGPEALWQFLCEGRSAVGEVPPDRWSAFDDGSPEVAETSPAPRVGIFLTDIDAFDAEFFGISVREGQHGPQQRLLLEVAWRPWSTPGFARVLRHHRPESSAASIGEYAYLASTDLPAVDAWSNSGGALSIIANRLSYFLDLRGPSLTVDTACSSSLVALHLACQSLRTQDSDVAIAAGVNLLLSPAVFRGFDQSGALSPTGSCLRWTRTPMGSSAARAGVVVLKRLTDAVRDGDRLLAVVRGSAVNQDGRSNGLLAPNPAAQMAVLRAAYANAGVPPHEVDYIETHGTGTLLGDPIEARALGTVLDRGRPVQSPLFIGAVKSNLGHLEAAAGMAGFIKAVLAVQRASIPANLGFQTPNPHIAFDQMRLKVVADQQEWPSVVRPRRAGVSSFGFGGTNAHVVIEQAPPPKPVVRASDSTVTTLVVSGDAPERIASAGGGAGGLMYGDGRRVCPMAHTGEPPQPARPVATVLRDRAQAVAGLQALAAGWPADGAVGPLEVVVPALCSCTVNSHWAGSSAIADRRTGVCRRSPNGAGVCRTWVFAAAGARDGEPVSGDAQVQPVMMGLQLALTALWRSYGVHPDAVIGHSMGEVSAAVVAGALSVADGLRVIAIRSRLMSQLAGTGAVALLKLDADATAALIAEFSGVSAAGYLSPRETVIAGPVAPVDAVIAAVSARTAARRVNMEAACIPPFDGSDPPRIALAD
jgi:phthiocerol/phenolphthiocerol synthesis type-I polyketide synthase B